MVQQLMLEDPMVKVKEDSDLCFRALTAEEMRLYLRSLCETG